MIHSNIFVEGSQENMEIGPGTAEIAAGGVIGGSWGKLSSTAQSGAFPGWPVGCYIRDVAIFFPGPGLTIGELADYRQFFLDFSQNTLSALFCLCNYGAALFD
jgi:hypothetical protein